MKQDPGAIEANLAAAVGDEPALIAELRVAFTESVRRGLEGLESARDDAGWQAAALRLKGLAASFGAVSLMAMAIEAEASGPADAALLARLRRAVDAL